MTKEEAFLEFIICKIEYTVAYRKLGCSIPATEFELLAFEMGYEAAGK